MYCVGVCVCVVVVCGIVCGCVLLFLSVCMVCDVCFVFVFDCVVVNGVCVEFLCVLCGV